MNNDHEKTKNSVHQKQRGGFAGGVMGAILGFTLGFIISGICVFIGMPHECDSFAFLCIPIELIVLVLSSIVGLFTGSIGAIMGAYPSDFNI